MAGVLSGDVTTALFYVISRGNLLGREADEDRQGQAETGKLRMRYLAPFGVLILTACQAAGPETAPTPAENVGRYQIASVPGTTQAILLDTATGKTWYRVSTGTSDKQDVTQWLPMDKTDVRQWMELNAPRSDKLPDGAHPYRP